MHPVKEKSLRRQEQILLTFKNFDYLTISQLQRLHDLKSYRNAHRVINQLESFLNVFKDDGVNVYYLNKEGREAVNSSYVRTKLTTAKHYIMRNDLYIHLGMPKSWQNEIKMISGANTSKEIIVVADAHYINSNKHYVVEVDNLQKMQKNKIKIDKYRTLIQRNAFKGMPMLIWVTTTQYRQSVLKELCEGLDCTVYLKEDLI
ncbi:MULTISPECIES: replication-relaxation family protein [unclassified Oceanobacillus]|uniref:replication-relaxation family protein n=1 Tax=unclassified Oceanobacillus TaxID=2630292 RepID=UPI001BE57723|nr:MULTISPECIES: replication-relaxation family protein [unclassified Oceanobacillus]MBT2599070.1 replication-relaxation family protein [Oceanobacillus sp. ISL-74]MBT2651988.1 replication-relaxation family protein [Oceanobacillus sp. ISL-73]